MSRPSPKEELPVEAWDFVDRKRLPDDQCEIAYFWEFAIGLDRKNVLCESIIVAREKLERVKKIVASEEFKVWALLNAPPPGQIDIFRDLVLMEQMEARFPGSTWVPESLDERIHFLIRADEFPARHWQQLNDEERKRQMEMFPGLGGLEKRPLCVVPGKFGWSGIKKGTIHWESEYRDSNPSELEYSPTGLFRGNRWEQWSVLHVNWARTDDSLKADFAHWLEVNRPADRQAFFKKNPNAINGNCYRRDLKALGAARVLASFGGDRSRAVTFAKSQYKKMKELKLPKDPTNFSRRAESAAKYLQGFEGTFGPD